MKLSYLYLSYPRGDGTCTIGGQAIRLPDYTQVETADLNGDRYPDRVFMDQTPGVPTAGPQPMYYALNPRTGSDIGAIQRMPDDAAPNHYYVDINSDGITDVLTFNNNEGSCNRVYLSAFHGSAGCSHTLAISTAKAKVGVLRGFNVFEPLDDAEYYEFGNSVTRWALHPGDPNHTVRMLDYNDGKTDMLFRAFQAPTPLGVSTFQPNGVSHGGLGRLIDVPQGIDASVETTDELEIFETSGFNGDGLEDVFDLSSRKLGNMTVYPFAGMPRDESRART